MKPAFLIVCLLAAFLACFALSVPAQVSDPATPSAMEPSVIKSLTRTNDIPPGIYESAPFTCIVLVPDHNIDPHFVVAPRMPSSAMPVIQPEMRLIPRSPSRQMQRFNSIDPRTGQSPISDNELLDEPMRYKPLPSLDTQSAVSPADCERHRVAAARLDLLFKQTGH